MEALLTITEDDVREAVKVWLHEQHGIEVAETDLELMYSPPMSNSHRHFDGFTVDVLERIGPKPEKK